MNLGWYIKRLRAMSIPEVSWRVGKLMWQFRARYSYQRWNNTYRNHKANPELSIASMKKVAFFGINDETAKHCSSAYKDNIIQTAEKLMNHKFKCLALGDIDLGETVNFNHEYKRHIDTPLIFGPWMDYRQTKELGDFKYFWEVPRLQHLILLAKAYYVTKEDKYAKEVITQLTQFWDQTPYLMGVNWTVAMEAGIRLISFSWIAQFLKGYLAFNHDALSLIEGLVLSHCYYTEKYYAAYSSANNHLIGEAAGVYVASICFNHLPGMDKYRENAHHILSREITLQHFTDGVNKEQATHYQLFALYFFLMAGLIGKQNHNDYPQAYWDTIKSSTQFLASLGHDHHSIPQIGDSDDGRAVVLSEQDDDLAVVLQVAKIAMGIDEPYKAPGLFESTCWLLGYDQCKLYEPAEPSTKIPPSKHFDEGGYYIFNGQSHNKHVQLVIDCAPLGFGSLAAHGHADALHFILSINGTPFFVDPGTYIYEKDNKMRNYFRSTASHNTIEIDQTDQSEISGPFLWNTKADAKLETFNTDGNIMEFSGSHNGYLRLEDPVNHHRHIAYDQKKATIAVADKLDSNNKHTATMYYHLAPSCTLEKTGNNEYLITNKDHSIKLTFDNQLELNTHHASDQPLSGWFSHFYDHIEPTNTLAGHCVFTGHITLNTTIEVLS